MTERRADIIAGKFHDARPKFAEAFHADAYEVERTTRVPDGSGGYTEAPVVVESGYCALDSSNVTRQERLVGGVMTSIAAYTVEMADGTDLRASDALLVNGRRFSVIDVKRAGEISLFPTATVEEAS